MFRRSVAASILIAWFGLAGIVLGEVTGFIEEPPDAQGSVETALASIAKCLRTSKVYKPILVPLLTSASFEFLSITLARLSWVSAQYGERPVEHPVRLHVLMKIFLI